jgi:hypothetical protein
MGAPKLKPSELKSLFPEEKDKSLQDKKFIEALKNRLNEKLQNPVYAKKAALILSDWINRKK